MMEKHNWEFSLSWLLLPSRQTQMFVIVLFQVEPIQEACYICTLMKKWIYFKKKKKKKA